jgi:ATP-dependent Clp protease protease subunit
MKNPVPSFRAAKKVSDLHLFVYNIIGDSWGYGITASAVQQAISAAGEFSAIILHINSPGGDCFEGIAIYNIVRQQKVPVTVIVEGLAASAAFTVAMAGDTIQIGDAAMMMLHNAWAYTSGYACEIRQVADLLDKLSGTMAELYAKRSALASVDVQSLMDAETWLTADEAIAKGFATEKLEADAEESSKALAFAASFNLDKLCAHVPEALKAARKQADKADPAECACTCQPCKDGDCAACTHDPCGCDGCTCKNDSETEASASVRTNILLREIELVAQ